MPQVLVFGESLIDEYPDRRVVAGAPLHVAVHLASRGSDVTFLTRVGDDEDGEAVRAVLEGCGVDISRVEVDDDLSTGTVSITFDADGSHDFTIHRPAAWDSISGLGPLPDHDALVYGTLAGRDVRSRAALLRVLEGSTAPVRVCDINLRPPDVVPDVIRAAVAAATLLKMGADEVPVTAGHAGVGPDPGAFLSSFPDLDLVLVTHGSDGAEVVARDGSSHRIAGADVDVVDTVGAGDTFTAGMVDALLSGAGPGAALDAGAAAAADVLKQRGGLPPCAGGGDVTG